VQPISLRRPTAFRTSPGPRQVGSYSGSNNFGTVDHPQELAVIGSTWIIGNHPELLHQVPDLLNVQAMFETEHEETFSTTRSKWAVVLFEGSVPLFWCQFNSLASSVAGSPRCWVSPPASTIYLQPVTLR